MGSGVGTYSTNTLARTTVLDSTNSNALVNFSSGTKAVFIAQPAGRAVYSNGTSIVSADGVPVGTTGGGTGVTSYTAGIRCITPQAQCCRNWLSAQPGR